MKKTQLITIIAVAALALTSGISTTASAAGFLGVYPQTIDKDLMEAFDLDVDYGVVIRSVVPDSPAEEAGIEKGDIILQFNNRKLHDADDLYRLMRRSDSGDEVELVIVRDGEKKELEIVLGSPDEDEGFDLEKTIIKKGRFPKTFTKSYSSHFSSLADTYIGVTLEDLNEQLGEYFGIENGEGALVTEVLEDSPAGKAGLKAGDVIIKAGDKKIEELADVQNVVRKADEGDKLEFTVIREKKEKEIAVIVEESPKSFSHFETIVLPDMDDFHFFAPKMKGLKRGNFFFDDDVDMDEEDIIDFRLALASLEKLTGFFKTEN